MFNQPYIIFNNINSLDIKDLIVSELPTPDIASKRVTKTQVVGRNGDLRILQPDVYGYDTYDSVDRTVKLSYLGKNYNVISNWLRGTGKLIYSNEPDRYWKASIDNVIPFEKVIRQMYNFTVTFSCFPYAYLNIGDEDIVYMPTENVWETIIMNDYDISLPHIKIFGQGDIGILINGVETDFYSVDGYIECDSELQQCYKDIQNLGSNMSGQFPALYPGKNVIEFTGNINKVLLTPRWRVL